MKTSSEKKQIHYARSERSVGSEREPAKSIGREHRALTKRELPKNMLRPDTEGGEGATTKLRAAAREGLAKRPDTSLGDHLSQKRIRPARP
jgi:hypothetical protein